MPSKRKASSSGYQPFKYEPKAKKGRQVNLNHALNAALIEEQERTNERAALLSEMNSGTSVQEYSPWMAFTAILAMTLVIIHPYQRVPGLSLEVSRNLNRKVIDGCLFMLFDGAPMIAYATSDEKGEFKDITHEMHLNFSDTPKFVLNGTHRLFALFAFFVGFITIPNLYVAGYYGTFCHPDANGMHGCHRLIGWRAILETYDRTHICYRMVQVLIAQFGEPCGAEGDCFHDDVIHGFAYFTENMESKPTRATIDEDSGEITHHSYGTTENHVEINMYEYVQDPQAALLFDRIFDKFHTDRCIKLKIIKREGTFEHVNIGVTRDLIFKADAFTHRIHDVSGIMAMPLFTRMQYAIFNLAPVSICGEICRLLSPHLLHFNQRHNNSAMAIAQYVVLTAACMMAPEKYMRTSAATSVCKAMINLKAIFGSPSDVMGLMRTIREKKATLELPSNAIKAMRFVCQARLFETTESEHSTYLELLADIIDKQYTNKRFHRPTSANNEDHIMMMLSVAFHALDRLEILEQLEEYTGLTPEGLGKKDQELIDTLWMYTLVITKIPRTAIKAGLMSYFKRNTIEVSFYSEPETLGITFIRQKIFDRLGTPTTVGGPFSAIITLFDYIYDTEKEPVRCLNSILNSSMPRRTPRRRRQSPPPSPPRGPTRGTMAFAKAAGVELSADNEPQSDSKKEEERSDEERWFSEEEDVSDEEDPAQGPSTRDVESAPYVPTQPF